MGKLTAYMLLAFLWTLQVALADAPVIWYGTTAKWLPSGLHSAGLCKTDVNGIFTVGASGTDYAPPTSGTAILKGNGSGGFSSAVSSTDYAPATSSSSILKGNGSGGFSSAVSSTDYAPPTTGSALLKGNGSGGFSNAASGTDYAPATSGSSVLKGNGSGGFANAVAGTDYQVPITSGDGTTSAGALTLGTNVVTNAKASQMAANTIKGNNTGSTANAIDMTVAQLKTLLAYAFSDITGTLTASQLPAPSTSTFTTNVDWSLSKNIDYLYTQTLSASRTLTFSNLVAGQTIVMAITNTASNWTVTWPSAAKWLGGTAPTQTVGAHTDVITCKSYDGTNAYCTSVQNF